MIEDIKGDRTVMVHIVELHELEEGQTLEDFIRKWNEGCYQVDHPDCTIFFDRGGKELHREVY